MKHLRTAPAALTLRTGELQGTSREKGEHRERRLSEGTQVSPVLGGGGMWGEEDVLDNACVPLFHGSLPWMLVLRVGQEILGKT